MEREKIILSIHPKFVDNIFNGIKKFEFRRKIWNEKKAPSHALIYATSPINKIVGDFLIGVVLHGTPDFLWQQSGENENAIDHDSFNQYFKEVDKGYAISILLPLLYKTPQTLEHFGIKTAPQSFCYINETQWNLRCSNTVESFNS
jgi:predicted transcriptional regulator